MSERVILTADEGMVLTDGTNYGRVIYLAEGADPAAYHQITEAEFSDLMENQATSEAVAVLFERYGVEVSE